MEEVTIDQLEVGDHIVLSCQSYFKYLIVLRKPEIGKHTHWKTGKSLYRAVKCSGKRDLITGPGGWKYYKWVFTPEDHNTVQYINFYDRPILRINK